MAPPAPAKGENVLRIALLLNLVPSFIFLIVAIATSVKDFGTWSPWKVNGFGIPLVLNIFLSAATAIAYLRFHRKPEPFSSELPNDDNDNQKKRSLAVRILLSPVIDVLAFSLYISFLIPFIALEFFRLEYHRAAAIAETFFLPFIFINMYIHAYLALYKVVRFVGQRCRGCRKTASVECPNCGHHVARNARKVAVMSVGGSDKKYGALGRRRYRDEEEASMINEAEDATRASIGVDQALVSGGAGRDDNGAVSDERFETKVGENTSLLKSFD